MPLPHPPPAKSKIPRSREMRAPSNQVLLACSARPQRARSGTWEGSCQGSSVSLLTQRWVLSHRYLRDGCELQPGWGRCRKPSQILHLLATGNAGFRTPGSGKSSSWCEGLRAGPLAKGERPALQTVPGYCLRGRKGRPRFLSLSAPAQAQCPGHSVFSCQGRACCQLVVVNESEERVIN